MIANFNENVEVGERNNKFFVPAPFRSAYGQNPTKMGFRLIHLIQSVSDKTLFWHKIMFGYGIQNITQLTFKFHYFVKTNIYCKIYSAFRMYCFKIRPLICIINVHVYGCYIRTKLKARSHRKNFAWAFLER